MKFSEHQIKSLDVSLTNRLRDIEEKILGLEDKVEENVICLSQIIH